MSESSAQQSVAEPMVFQETPDLGCMGDHICTIVPHYVLESICNCDDAHEDAKTAARNTLLHTQNTLLARREAFVASFGPGGPSGAPQSIVPEYMLSNIAGSDEADPAAVEAAQRTLAMSRDVRAAREGVAVDAEAAARLPRGDEPARPNRLVYNSGQTEDLQEKLVRSEGDGPTNDLDIDECYDGFGATFQLFWEKFGRNSIDDRGMDLIGNCHYGVSFNNAFWDGQQMVFGDGDGIIFQRFTKSIDVIAHELTHGVTDRTARLVYRNQSGALNESMSDVFGSMLKQFHLNQKVDEADWLIGEGLLAEKIKGVALRSMKAPGTAYNDPMLGGKDPQPDHMSKFVKTSADQGGVHLNSGIPNRAFYLAATEIGGYSWETAGQIWYKTLLDRRLRPNATFQQFADLSCTVALKAYDSKVRQQVADAWTKVGITPSDGGHAAAPAAGST